MVPKKLIFELVFKLIENELSVEGRVKIKFCTKVKELEEFGATSPELI